MENLNKLDKIFIRSLVFLTTCLIAISSAQSIGHHSNLNFGFNPYLSPVFGYGLGLPYGAYSPLSPMKSSPFIAGSLLNPATPLASKLHTKSILKEFNEFPVHHGLGNFAPTIKEKLALLKQQKHLKTPYTLDYGYGKHYGSAMILNHPYKKSPLDHDHLISAASSKNLIHQAADNHFDHHLAPMVSKKSYSSIIKPLAKAGAIVATAALIKGAKHFPLSNLIHPIYSYSKLNPAGMISSQASAIN